LRACSNSLKNGGARRDRHRGGHRHLQGRLFVRISLIVSTYNWPEALDLVLTSVFHQRRMPDEVLVADDGSSAPTAEVVRGWAARMPVAVHHLWQEDEGYRLARARNRAIAAACGDYVITLDGDMILDPHFIADHERASERGWFVQGPRAHASAEGTARMLKQRSIRFGPLRSGMRRRHLAVRNLWLAKRYTRDYVTMRRIRGCNQAFWRSDLIAVNGFEERMVGWGPEDKECATRLLNSGVRGREVRFMAVACHLEHASRETEGVTPNDVLLETTIRDRRKRCELGVDQHLAEFAGGIPARARSPWTV
jgi:glycosyltransferase involved in cell wall biosynthesis